MTEQHFHERFMSYSLQDFIYNFPEIAHFKESKSFTYQFSNRANLDVYNINDEKDIVGKTVFDLKNEIMKTKWSCDFANEIHESDIMVLKKRQPIKLDYKTFLNKSGYVVIHSILKLPVFDSNRDICGILTLSFNSTNTESYTKIRELYFIFYNKKTEANEKFMSHFGFNEGSSIKLSSREMDCLLGLVRYRRIKKASRFIGITSKTFDNHLNNIRKKISQGCSLEKLIDILSEKIRKN